MAKRAIRVGAFVILAIAAIVLVRLGVNRAGAQSGGAQQPLIRVSVQITQIKPDMADTYRALIRDEVLPAEKKAGVAWRHTFTGTPLGQQFIYVVVRPVTSLAQFDEPGPLQRALGPEAAAKLNARVNQTIVSRRAMIQTLQPNLSIDSGSTQPANLVIVEEVQVQLGKGAEFNELMTQQMIPALKKAGVKDYLLFNTAWGGPAQLRTIVEPIANFAALEPTAGQPARLARALGAEAAQKLNAQQQALVERRERWVMRLVPELSFGQRAAVSQMTSR